MKGRAEEKDKQAEALEQIVTSVITEESALEEETNDWCRA